MSRLAFSFSYQSFARYVRDNCDSEQETDGTQVDEKWLYRNMSEYLDKKAGHAYEFSYETLAPEEFKTHAPGAPRRMDVVGYSRRQTKERPLAMFMEAKLMVQENREWAREIFADILRAACVQQNTTRKTQRYVLVAGQKRCWEQAERQRDGLLSKICPMIPKRDIKTLFLTRKCARTVFTLDWKQQHKQLIDDYLESKIPGGIDVELVGYSPSNRQPDEQPEAGITVRLWRVYPR